MKISGNWLLATCAGILTLIAGPVSANVVHVVAAENFYGDIISQIGGNHVAVTSIMSDPNIDPHEYESNVSDAEAVANAALVLENGAGYDDWMDKLIGASPDRHRIVLKGFDLATTKIPDNEHVWYDPHNVLAIGSTLVKSLKRLDPTDASDFDSNDQAFDVAITKLLSRIQAMRVQLSGTPIALTETIFQYPARLLGLNILTPQVFQKAIAEGNDPPADAVIEAERQVKESLVKAFVYNEQTVTPATTKLQDDARTLGIPIVAVTETMPDGLHYQDWMLDELEHLKKVLTPM